MSNQESWIVGILIIGGGGLYALLLIGAIGSKNFRQRMRRLTQWESYDSQPFFPIDTQKPIASGLKEMTQNVLPNKRRIIQYFRGLLFWFIAFIIGLVIGYIVNITTENSITTILSFGVYILTIPFVAAYILPSPTAQI